MSTTAGALLNIMMVRKELQDDGLVQPHPSVVIATRQLILALQTLPVDDRIEIDNESNPLRAKYVRSQTGEVLAQIDTSEAR